MNDPKAIIIELLSVPNGMARGQQARSLQTALRDLGYTKNADEHDIDGRAGRLTIQDTVDFIRDNPEALVTMDPAVVQRLFRAGHRDALKDIVESNPEIAATLNEQAIALVPESGDIDELNGSLELREFQTKMALVGFYNARIDGRTGPTTRVAAVSLQPPIPVARPTNLEPVIVANDFSDAAQSDPVEPNVVAQTVDPENIDRVDEERNEGDQEQRGNLERYFEALDFTERGLRRGDRGWDWKEPVRNMQVLLNRAGIETGVDGSYGPQTQRNVRTFQEQNGLPVTGIADAATLRALVALESSAPSVETKDNPYDYTSLEQRLIIEHDLPLVQEDTGISQDFLRGIWGIESVYSTGFSSGTGSEGPMQFIPATFRLMMRRHADDIADDLRARGHGELADRVEAMHTGKVDYDLRHDPRVAIYAAAYLTINNGYPNITRSQWSSAFAEYNLGPTAAGVLHRNLDTANVKNLVGSAARRNPQFFRNGATGRQALENYQSYVESRSEGFDSEYTDRIEPFRSLMDDVSEAEVSTVAPSMVVAAQTVGRPF